MKKMMIGIVFVLLLGFVVGCSDLSDAASDPNVINAIGASGPPITAIGTPVAIVIGAIITTVATLLGVFAAKQKKT